MEYRQVLTENEVLSRVSGIDQDGLVMMRIELGHDYARKFGDKQASEIIQTRVYWNWWLRIWEINDKQLLDRMNRGRYDTVDIYYYRRHHREYSRKFNMIDVVDQTIKEINSKHQKQLA